jgi:hypothetical protein
MRYVRPLLFLGLLAGMVLSDGLALASQSAVLVKDNRPGSASFVDRRGLVASTIQGDGSAPPVDRCFGNPFQCAPEQVGLTATSWAISAEQDFNPLTPQLPLPTKVGEVFVIDDFDNDVTRSDLGFNYFMGNTGATESAEGTTTISWSEESNGSVGGSLNISFDFTGQPAEGPFAGYFASLFGLTDTKVSLDGSGTEPEETTPFPGYFLDTEDIYRDLSSLPDRSVEELQFDIRLESSEDVTLKIELRDEEDFDVFTRRTITDTGGGWQPISLAIPDSFTDSVEGGGNPAPFDWNRVSVFSVIVERVNEGAGVSNPTTGEFLIDNLAVVDTDTDEDGEYPDLEAIRDPGDGSLLPQYTEAFLDLVRATSFLYFLDFASTDDRTGGIIQDRSTFADLMSVGGVGFQLTSYVVGAERGYISREDAASRVHSILAVLNNEDGEHPQGPNRVGTTGYKGFFYHFLGIDGLRKQNFDFTETEMNESLNTVELSTIDTALAMASVLTARQYFDGGSETENDIRSLADQIYARVDWPFMLHPGAPAECEPDGPGNQFYLGWKPNEERDDDSGRFGRFKLDDADGLGQYSSKDVDGEEVPATVDFYTDEGILIALLAIASPTHPVDEAAFFCMKREGTPFIKTYPGSLFTYQFASVWLDTAKLGPDDHPTDPIDYFENTRSAILATRQYACDNPSGRATLNCDRWGLSATEGPFDDYFAEAAPPAAMVTAGQCIGSGAAFTLEGEDGTGDGKVKQRGAASNQKTVLLKAGESRTLSFDLDGTARYEVIVRYSNDGPRDSVQVSIDDTIIGQCTTQDTRPSGGVPGSGWNVFFSCEPLGPVILSPGQHELVISAETDLHGVEIDVVSLSPIPVERPLEVGTVTVYGVGSSVLHTPNEAAAALWDSASLGLLHPRFGFADAFNLEIGDAAIPGCLHPDESRVLRASGPWANFTGFGIDHGPMLILIDNYLEDQFVPHLFMSSPPIWPVLARLFPTLDSDGDGWTDGAELTIGTDPQNGCTPNGWPPDPAPSPDGNGVVQIDDVTFAAGAFGSTTTPRAEIASQNGVVQIDDVTAFAGRFGDTC